MSFRGIHRSLLSGLLLSALLLQSLLPAFAALRSDEGARWIEVCISSGIKWVKLDPAGPDTAPPVAAAHGDHCVLCAATGAVPAFDASVYLRAHVVAMAALPRLISPVTAFPGHALRSRAPPTVS
jgi:hypothetical protein